NQIELECIGQFASCIGSGHVRDFLFCFGWYHSPDERLRQAISAAGGSERGGQCLFVRGCFAWLLSTLILSVSQGRTVSCRNSTGFDSGGSRGAWERSGGKPIALPDGRPRSRIHQLSEGGPV